MVKYPKQVYAFKKSKKTQQGVVYTTLGVDMKLYAPDYENGADTPPMEMYAPYSVFLVTLIATGATEKKTPKANIPVQDVGFLAQKVQWCNQVYWENQCTIKVEKPQDSSTDSEIKKILGMKVNGSSNQTYQELIAKSGKNGLLRQMKFCSNFTGNFGNINKTHYEYCQILLKSLESGALESEMSDATVSEFVVYDSGIKFFKSEKNEQGLTKCYNIKVIFNKDMNYPYNVTITNNYNSVTKQADGTMRVGSENVDVQKVSTRLSLSEFTRMINVMDRRMMQFEICNFSKMNKLMDEISWHPKN